MEATHTFCMRWYERDNIKKTILLAGITLAVYVVMKYILPVVIPFLLGGMLAVLLNPTVERLVRRTGKGRGIISALVVAVVLAAVGALCFFAGKEACRQLAALVKNIDAVEGNIRDFFCDCCERVERSFGMQIADEADRIFTTVENKVRARVQAKTLPFLLENSVNYAKCVFSMIGIALVSVISGLLILNDYPVILSAVQRSEIGALASMLKQRAKAAGGTYLKAQATILLIISVICVIGLLLSGNSYALIVGMGIGLCDALPFVGTGTIFVPWMLVDIMSGKYVLAALYGVLYVICSFVRQMLEPRLIGNRLGYPPIAVLMSIYIGMHVYGGAGVVLGPLSAFFIYEIYTACCNDLQ